MSQELINRSPDLKKLVDERYEVEIFGGYLIIHHVPYVNSKREVEFGALASALTLAGDITQRPGDHTVLFSGEHPCDENGNPIDIIAGNPGTAIRDGLVMKYMFSHKIPSGYEDYHQKMEAYANILSTPSSKIVPGATAKTGIIRAHYEESPFCYAETASSRTGITEINQKLASQKVAIVGLGGTGSYVLDLVSKTHVKEIHLFDSDDFLQHNAFRAPGAASLDDLRNRKKKVQYFAERYGAMRGKIFPCDAKIDNSNIDVLSNMDFVFICIDQNSVKRLIIDKLQSISIPFVDSGMGIESDGNSLSGLVRVTTSTKDMQEHILSKPRINLHDEEGEENVYSTDIQVAELNALNATLAVIKWKKIFKFYDDLKKEHHCVYMIDGNTIINEDNSAA